MPGMDRLIIVYNARNADALTSAKSLLQRYRRHKVIAAVAAARSSVARGRGRGGSWPSSMRSSRRRPERSNVRGRRHRRGLRTRRPARQHVRHRHSRSGHAGEARAEHPIPDDARRMLVEVARFYLAEAKADGFALIGLDEGRSRGAHRPHRPQSRRCRRYHRVGGDDRASSSTDGCREIAGDHRRDRREVDPPRHRDAGLIVRRRASAYRPRRRLRRRTPSTCPPPFARGLREPAC